MARFARQRHFRPSKNIISEKEKLRRRAIFFGILTIIFSGLLVIWGIPFFIKLADFLGRTKDKTQQEMINKDDQIPPLPPRFVFIPEATNSATIPLAGFSEKDSQVKIYVNDKLAVETKADDKGEFALKKINLSLGRNAIWAVAIDKAGNKSDLSDKSSVVYDNELPPLELESPRDGATVYDQKLDIKGKTDPEAKITVNGHLVMAESDGKFVYQFELAEGVNDIEILVKDLAGNETRKKLKITYHI